MPVYPDGPTQRLGGGPVAMPGPPRTGVAVAVLLAMLAVVISAGALLLSWRALTIAETANPPAVQEGGSAADPGR